MPTKVAKKFVPGPRKVREAEFPPEVVRDLSEKVYRERLGEGGAERMIAEDGDQGQKLRTRAAVMDDLTRSYLRAFSV